MLALVSSTLLPSPSKTSTINLYHEWKSNNQHGNRLHQHKQFTQAISYFKASVSLSKQLQEYVPDDDDKKSGLEMLYIASHNLAACYNANNQTSEASATLQAFHSTLMNTSSNHLKPRSLRLEALANLDKSLFSLTSQLGHTNQAQLIYSLILQTEHVASTASEELLGAPLDI